MKKIWYRILLDLILVVGAATLYSYRTISMSYHEIGGLVLFGLFVVHLIFNHKWIKSIFVKLFSPKMPLRTRILCVVDILLLLSWAVVIVTGAGISKAIFSFHHMQWKMFHFFIAAVALILTGIHLGFHVKYLGMFFQKLFPIRLPKPAKIILIVVLSVAIVACGAVNYANSGMSRWLSAPFGMAGGPPGGGPGGPGGPSAEANTAEAPQDNASEPSSEPGDRTGGGTEAASGEPADAGAPANQTASNDAAGDAPAQPDAGGVPGGPGGPGGPPSGEMSINWGNVFAIIWQYASIVLAIMTIVGWADHLCLSVKSRKRAKKADASE